MSASSVWSDEWDWDDDWSGGGAEGRRLPRGDQLGATLYRLEPGDSVPFHFHHAQEELLVVLQGRPTLRTSDGERVLEDGEVVVFPVGPAGAHALRNADEAPVRYLVASTQRLPEVAEYPDLARITAQAHTASLTGDRLWFVHDVVDLD